MCGKEMKEIEEKSGEENKTPNEVSEIKQPVQSEKQFDPNTVNGSLEKDNQIEELT